MRESRYFHASIARTALLALAVSSSASALQVTEFHPGPVTRPITRVLCDGRVCGGSGGASASPFLYRIRPHGNRIDAFDVGVVRANVIDQRAQRGRDFHTLEIEHDAIRPAQAEEAVLDGRPGLQRDPRVLGRGPDARRRDLDRALGCRGMRENGQGERCGRLPPARPQCVSKRFKHARPASVSA